MKSIKVQTLGAALGSQVPTTITVLQSMSAHACIINYAAEYNYLKKSYRVCFLSNTPKKKKEKKEGLGGTRTCNVSSKSYSTQ